MCAANSNCILKSVNYKLASDLKNAPLKFAHASATWNTQTQHISLQSQKKQLNRSSNSSFHFIKRSCF